MTNTTLRHVLAGKLEDGVYFITLDGDQIVQTIDDKIAQAAATAKTRQAPVIVALETIKGAKHPVLIELRSATADEIAAAAKPAMAIATSAAAAPAPAAKAGVLTRDPIPTGLITDPMRLTEQLKALARSYNVISPMIAVSQFAPGYGVNLVVVQIDTTIVDAETGRGTDTYYNKRVHKPNERSLSKTGLLKISQALGIKWAQPRRVDNGDRPNYWHWQYYGVITTYDGQTLPVTGSRELDLRPGSEEAKMSEAQLKVARTFGNEICETKAMERAIRNFVRQSYTLEELAKPFLIPRFSFTPDMDDPAIKRLVTERALDGNGAFFPPPAPEIPASVTESAAATPALPAKKDPFTQDTASGATASARQIPGAAKDFKLPEDALFLKEAKVAGSGKYASKAGSWTRYEIVAETGELFSTFSDKHKAAADDAIAKQWPVRVVGEEDEKYPGQLTLKSIEVIDPRQGDLLGAGTDARGAGY